MSLLDYDTDIEEETDFSWEEPIMEYMDSGGARVSVVYEGSFYDGFSSGRVIVKRNDNEHSSRPVGENFSNGGRLNLPYFLRPHIERGIPLAELEERIDDILERDYPLNEDC